MAKSKLLPIVALAGAAAVLLTSGSASAKTSKTSTGTNGGSLGDEGMPAGPDGCKAGLVEKNGVCVLPSVNDDVNKDDKNQGGDYTPSPSSLTISLKCDKFTFGDKTGEAWWNNHGYNTAKTYIPKGYDNPLHIAYKMLIKNKEACFKEFPDFDKYMNKPAGSGEYALISWIREYPKIWELIWWLRNKIDMTFFQGETTTTIDPKTWKISYGKDFEFEVMWDSGIRQIAEILIYLEEQNPGILLNNKKETQDLGLETSNATTYLYWILFPNIDFATLIARYKKNQLSNDEFWSNLWDHIADIDVLDLEFDPDQVILEENE